jgi:hypothetical protein
LQRIRFFDRSGRRLAFDVWGDWRFLVAPSRWVGISKQMRPTPGTAVALGAATLPAVEPSALEPVA